MHVQGRQGGRGDLEEVAGRRHKQLAGHQLDPHRIQRPGQNHDQLDPVLQVRVSRGKWFI